MLPATSAMALTQGAAEKGRVGLLLLLLLLPEQRVVSEGFCSAASSVPVAVPALGSLVAVGILARVSMEVAVSVLDTLPEGVPTACTAATPPPPPAAAGQQGWRWRCCWRCCWRCGCSLP